MAGLSCTFLPTPWPIACFSVGEYFPSPITPAWSILDVIIPDFNMRMHLSCAVRTILYNCFSFFDGAPTKKVLEKSEHQPPTFAPKSKSRNPFLIFDLVGL